ncbi:MAG: hypothetical protein D6E12_02070 [Desulfovibrio sp.]|nr:MAG: hypothetical protein D6E12_02070 [Desulfovibrio sp.]
MNQDTPLPSSRRRLSIAYILYGLIVLALVLEGGFGQSFLYVNLNEFAAEQAAQSEEALLEKEEAYLENLIDAPIAILESYHARSTSTAEIEQVIDALGSQIEAIWSDNSSNRTAAEKRELILELVELTRFGEDNSNYIWVNDHNYVLSHPKREVIGMDIRDPALNDRVSNISFLSLMVEECLRTDPNTGIIMGEARQLYWWPKANETDPKQKTSYMRYFPDLGWFLGAGIYVEDVEQEYLAVALNDIRNLRPSSDNEYGDNYYWVQSLDNVMLMHPISSELEGENLDNVTNSENFPLFREIVELCQGPEKGGSLQYLWGTPQDPEGSYRKLSYVKLFEPWGVIVGTGEYIDVLHDTAQQQSLDFKDKLTELTWKTMRLGLLAMVGIFVVVGLTIRVLLTGPIRSLSNYASSVAGGDSAPPDIEGRFIGELAVLKDSFKAMLAKLHDKVSEAELNAQEADKAAEETAMALEEAEQTRRMGQKIAAFQRQEVEQLSDLLAQMADGDFREYYAVSEADQDVAQAHAQESFLDIQEGLNSTITKLATMIQEIHKHSRTLFESAASFKKLSGNLSTSATGMSDQTGHVAGATEQMSTNVNTMASAAEEMNVNVSSVSGTTEEMSQAVNSITDSVARMTDSFSQVADNAQDGSRVAAQAMDMVAVANETMTSLGEAANEIGKVTEVIKRIAEQTNLLALNATIEAASAGDAGKGFAVVANEIKELANQSASAAEDISEKIGGVQANTKDAVKVINEVVTIISTIHQSVNEISTAMDEQMDEANEISHTMKQANVGIGDIASSMGELSKGANDMSRNVGEFAKALNEVANNILAVSRSVEANKGDASTIHTTAKKILKVSGRLLYMTKRFKMPS